VRHGYIKSSPRFFRLIKLSFFVFTISVLCLAIFVPAPLQEQGTIARVPNPVKSAWFLLWIQELVSHSKYMINLVIVLAICFIILPWLPWLTPAEKAGWFKKDQLSVNIFTILTYFIILALTVVAMFFRGENWAFIRAF
jgi:hypothetical protein